MLMSARQIGHRLPIYLLLLLRPKAAHNMYRQKKYQKLKSKIHQKLETIEKYRANKMHQFNILFAKSLNCN